MKRLDKRGAALFLALLFTVSISSLTFAKVSWGSAYKYKKAQNTGKSCTLAVGISCCVPLAGPALAQWYIGENVKAVTLAVIGGLTYTTAMVAYYIAFSPYFSTDVVQFRKNLETIQQAKNIRELMNTLGVLSISTCVGMVSTCMYSIIMLYSTANVIETINRKGKAYNLEIVNLEPAVPLSSRLV